MLKAILLYSLAMLLMSCSSYSFWPFKNKQNALLEVYQEIPPEDYLAHIEKLGQAYLQTSEVRTLNLSGDSVKYLQKVYSRVVSNNELLLKQNYQPTFYLIRENTPFVFSLPRGHFFISTGVINKYLRNEGVLVAALTYEIIKTHNKLFPRKRIVPIGYISTERLISLTRVPLDVRLEIDRWSFYALERAGYDPYAFMLWIQLQNKNALDFTLHYGDARGISREEFLLKNILVRERNDEAFDIDEQYQSSEDFYRFQQEVKRKSNP